VPARFATTADIPELIRLRAVMIESVGSTFEGGPWQERCAEVLSVALTSGEMAAVVVDRPEGDGLAACGVGMVAQRLPSLGCEDGRYGFVQSMCTDERHRRQGLARAVFEGLMGWFAASGVTRVDLHASAMGEPLYRSFGFVEGRDPELRWRATPRDGADGGTGRARSR
jgi:GNAT superfamily N-acetyltransferase